jgi:hypothetical protein
MLTIPNMYGHNVTKVFLKFLKESRKQIIPYLSGKSFKKFFMSKYYRVIITGAKIP